jgi:hypothetical protein
MRPALSGRAIGAAVGLVAGIAFVLAGSFRS